MKILLVFCAFFLFTNQVAAQIAIDVYPVDGSVTIYDYKQKKWFYSDSVDAKKLTLPASTFKIPNSLIALETGILKDENQILKWDGIPKYFLGVKMEAWNKDTDLKSAYKNSTIWFFVELAKRIKRDRYRKYLEICAYGNLNFSEKGIDFWNYGQYGISPVNQILFLRRLYEEELPFSKKHMATVKNIMISEKTANYVIRDKTGWTRKDGLDIGWWVGYVETKDNVYFFATRLTKSQKDDNPNFSKYRKEITKHVLKEMGAFD